MSKTSLPALEVLTDIFCSRRHCTALKREDVLSISLWLFLFQPAIKHHEMYVMNPNIKTNELQHDKMMCAQRRSESSLGTHHFVGFVVLLLILYMYHQ